MLFAATPVVAGDFEDGEAALEAGNWQGAFLLWHRAIALAHGISIAQAR